MVMNACAKTIVTLTLICYLAVSGVASVHATPISQSEAITNSSINAMSADCHTQSDDAQAMSGSTCKIFCSVLSNIVIADAVECLRSYPTAHLIDFHCRDVAMLSLAKEPYPPKLTPNISFVSKN